MEKHKPQIHQSTNPGIPQSHRDFMPNKVVVVGSYNTDMTIKTSRIPQRGETILGGSFAMHAGGKGANQAVAAARAGAEVWFIARVGDDELGRSALEILQAEGVHCEFVVRDKQAPTGTAFIIVDEHGENCIIVASGANMSLRPSDVAAASAVIASAEVLLLQLESPLETVTAAARLAHAHGCKVVLNPAPARALSTEVLRSVAVLTPNALEVEMLTGIAIHGESEMRQAAQVLLSHGVGTVLITLGARGVFAANAREEIFIPAFKVKAEDSTAAGDVFSGALCAFWQPQQTLREIVKPAAAAAALSVTKAGALNSAPRWEEIQKFLSEKKNEG